MPFLRLPGRPAVFYVNVLLAGVAMLTAFVVAPRDPEWHAHRSLDLPGALTVTAGETLLAFALVQGPEIGWFLPAILGCFAQLAIFLAVLIAFANGSAAGQGGVTHAAAVADGIGLAATGILVNLLAALTFPRKASVAGL